MLKTSHDHSLFAWRDNMTDTIEIAPRPPAAFAQQFSRHGELGPIWRHQRKPAPMREAIRLDGLVIHLSVFLGAMRIDGRRAAILCCRDKTWRNPNSRFVLMFGCSRLYPRETDAFTSSPFMSTFILGTRSIGTSSKKPTTASRISACYVTRILETECFRRSWQP